MTGIIMLLIGATIVLAVAAIGATAAMARKYRPAAVYAQLVLMVGIYVGFAIAGLDAVEFPTRGDWTILLLEALSALFFAIIGLNILNGGRAWMLGGLILLHGGIDLLHLLASAAHTPDWYAFACLIYDAIVGVGAIWLLSDDPAKD